MGPSLLRLFLAFGGTGIIISLMAYGSFMGVYYYTSTPEFCSSCHYVEPYVASWEKLSHKDVNCMLCHEPAGSLGKFHSKARGLNYYISDKTGNYIEPIIDAYFISEARCFGCHTGEIAGFPNAKKITNNRDHLQYIKNEQNCTDCHLGVGHELNISVDKVFNLE
ncbi:MAG: cytochrome c3 family protein [Bacillota bacterium]